MEANPGFFAQLEQQMGRRETIENALDVGMQQLLARLGVSTDPREWRPEESDRLRSLFSDPDMSNLASAMGINRAKCPTPKEAQRSALKLSENIFEHWNTLRGILECQEELLRKRWLKKNQKQRRAILLEVWPNMSPNHRPDLRAFRRESDKQRKEETRFEEAYRWPNINLEDLSKGKALLLFINARGRHQPETFASADLESIHVGQFSDALPRTMLLSHQIALKGQSPTAYSALTIMPPFANLAGIGFNAGDALDILEIQERVLDFLLKCSQIILKDKPGMEASNLTAIPVPEPPSLNSDMEWRSAPALAAAAPYNVPNQVDLRDLKTLVHARLSDAEDHFWALREDPGYFANVIGEIKEHSPEMILDDRRREHPDLVSPFRKIKFWGRLLANVITSAYEEIFLWRTLLGLFDELIKLDGSFVKSGFQLEEQDPEYLLVLRKIKYFLDRRVIPWQLMRIQNNFPASPPIRSSFQRKPTEGDGSGVYPRSEENIRKSKDDLLWLYAQFIDRESLQICGLETLAGELERLTASDPLQKQRVTPLVSNIFSDWGIVAELRNQLRIYRPRIFLTRGNKLLVAQEDSDLSEWNGSVTQPMLAIIKYLKEAKSGDKCIQLGRDGDPTTGKFYYPVFKRRTKETNQLMQLAENNLDNLWGHFDGELRARAGSNEYSIIEAMIPSRRQLQRTADWVEPVQLKRSEASSKRVGDDLADGISRINLQPFQQEPATEKPSPVKLTKTKTRGTTDIPRLDDTDTEQPQDVLLIDAQPKFTLKKRAYKVFSTIFHNPLSPDQPGEIAWSDFLFAMVSTGFVPTKLYGSVWQFNPSDLDVERSIQFHEPHPHGKIPYLVARRIGRRLNRAYGWTVSNFNLE